MNRAELTVELADKCCMTQVKVRKGRSPVTGAAVAIPARVKVKFLASAALKGILT